MANIGNDLDVRSLLNVVPHSYKDRDQPSRPDLSELVASQFRAQPLAKPAQNQTEDAVFQPSQEGIERAAFMQSVESAYHYSETMSISLTTKEGDRVDVDFRQLYSSYQSYKSLQAEENGPQGVRYFESREALEATAFEEHIGFSVQGDLNDAELQAIHDVFEKVDALANHFFNGDIEQAFQKAVELEVDFSQIGSLSVNMTQTEMKAVQYQQVAMAEYQRAQRAVEDEQASADEHVAEVGELPTYLQQWQEAITTLEAFFEDAQEAVSSLVGDVAAQKFPEQGSESSWLERVRAFHERLAESFLNQSTEASDSSENLEQDSLDNLTEVSAKND